MMKRRISERASGRADGEPRELRIDHGRGARKHERNKRVSRNTSQEKKKMRRQKGELLVSRFVHHAERIEQSRNARIEGGPYRRVIRKEG